MAFGIKKDELEKWKAAVQRGELAYLTHYWFDPRFPGINTVTKVGCADLEKLTKWCIENGLPTKYIHHRSSFPHFDLMGPKQTEILKKERQWQQLERFGMI